MPPHQGLFEDKFIDEDSHWRNQSSLWGREFPSLRQLQPIQLQQDHRGITSYEEAEYGRFCLTTIRNRKDKKEEPEKSVNYFHRNEGHETISAFIILELKKFSKLSFLVLYLWIVNKNYQLLLNIFSIFLSNPIQNIDFWTRKNPLVFVKISYIKVL